MKKQLLILPLLISTLAGCDNTSNENNNFDYKKALESVATEFAIVGTINQTIYADANKSIFLQEDSAVISQYTNVNWGEQEYYCHEDGSMDYQGTSYHFVGNEQGFASQISLLPDNTVGLVSTGYDFATTFTALDFLVSDDVGYEMVDDYTLKLVLGAGSEASTSLFFALTGYDGLGDVGKAYITFNENGSLKGINFETTTVGAYCFVNKYSGEFTTRDAMPTIDEPILPVESTLTNSQEKLLQSAFDIINENNYTLNILDGDLDEKNKYNGNYYCNYEIKVSHEGMVYTDLSEDDSDLYLNIENEGLYGVRVDTSTSPVTLTTTSEMPLNLLETFLVNITFSPDLFTYKGANTFHLSTLLEFAPTNLVPSSPFYNSSLWASPYGVDVIVETDDYDKVIEVTFYTIYDDGNGGLCAVTCSVSNFGTTKFLYSDYILERYVQPTNWIEYEVEYGEPYIDDAEAYFPGFEEVIPFYYVPSVNFNVAEDEYIAITYLATSYEQFDLFQDDLFALWKKYGWTFTMVEDNVNIYFGVHEESGATCEMMLSNYLAYGIGAFIDFVIFAPSSN